MNSFWDLLRLSDPESLADVSSGLQAGYNALLSGMPKSALEEAAAALRENSGNIPALLLSADCFQFYGKPIQALELLSKASSLADNSPSHDLLVCQQLLRMGRLAEAELRLQKIVVKFPVSGGRELTVLESLAWECFIDCLIAQARYESAWEELQGLLSVCEHLSGKAAEVLLRLNRPAEALALAQAHHHHLSSDDSALLLANCYFRCGDIGAYSDVLLSAFEANSDTSSLGTLAAQALFDRVSTAEHLEFATSVLSRVLKNQPQSPDAVYLRSRQLLLDGAFEEGWKAYQSRLNLPTSQLYAQCPASWQGEQAPHHLNVVVVAEQGIGDILFFARFLPQLAGEAAAVFLLVDSRLSPLLRRSYPQITVLEEPKLAQALAGADALWIPIASLPLRYASHLGGITTSSATPQLQIHPSLDLLWKTKLDASCGPTLKVGVSLTAGNDRQLYQQQKRDVDANVVASALKDLDATLVDLQHRNQLVIPSDIKILYYPEITSDIDHLCALLSRLDLLITADQTNAFIGGMLGVPTVAIVPPNPHFMFMRSGDRTPWFASLRIVRASGWAQWSGCDHLIGSAVQSLLKEYKPTLQFDRLAP